MSRNYQNYPKRKTIPQTLSDLNRYLVGLPYGSHIIIVNRRNKALDWQVVMNATITPTLPHHKGGQDDLDKLEQTS